MSHISQFDYDSADESSRAAYHHEVKARGHVTNMKRTLLHSAPAYHAYMQWYVLWGEVKQLLGARAAVIFAHSISSTNQCLLCSTFFRRALSQLGIAPDQFSVNEDEQLLVDLGRALARHYEPAPEDLWPRVNARYTERERVNLVAFAGLMVATNLFNNAVGVAVDDELGPFLPPVSSEPRHAAQ